MIQKQYLQNLKNLILIEYTNKVQEYRYPILITNF